jgi:hypothetical protein
MRKRILLIITIFPHLVVCLVSTEAARYTTMPGKKQIINPRNQFLESCHFCIAPAVHSGQPATQQRPPHPIPSQYNRPAPQQAAPQQYDPYQPNQHNADNTSPTSSMRPLIKRIMRTAGASRPSRPPPSQSASRLYYSSASAKNKGTVCAHCFKYKGISISLIAI